MPKNFKIYDEDEELPRVFKDGEGIRVSMSMMDSKMTARDAYINRTAEAWKKPVALPFSDSEVKSANDPQAWQERWTGQLPFKPGEASRLDNTYKNAVESDPCSTFADIAYAEHRDYLANAWRQR